MRKPEMVGPVEQAVGYVLKQAAVALRNAMDAALRPLHLTVPSTRAWNCWDNAQGCRTPNWPAEPSSPANR